MKKNKELAIEDIENQSIEQIENTSDISDHSSNVFDEDERTW